jgi:hypothetical protein
MPRKKKAIELTDEEALKRLFPKPVRDELKRIAHEKDKKPKPASKKSRSQE